MIAVFALITLIGATRGVVMPSISYSKGNNSIEEFDIANIMPPKVIRLQLKRTNHNAHPLPLNLEVKIGQIFHDMDTDKDFFISTTEISLFFAVCDSDNFDGSNPVSIDLNEFKQCWDYGDSESQKEHNFRQMDSNNNGALTEIDLITVFATADKNANGVLDFGEFDSYMRTVIYNNVWFIHVNTATVYKDVL